MKPGRQAALLIGLLGAPLPATLSAQTGSPAGPTSPESAPPQISLITFGPGPLVWEMFGHNMIRVTDSAAGTDLAYNFGIFDFRQKNFYWNFLQGRMLYWVEAGDAQGWLNMYRRMGRSIEIQELALTPEEARSLAASLARNAEPDQKTYRYDYYRDNCSTRVRDALDRSLGGVLERTLSGVTTSTTYRSKTAELTAGNPAIYFGLMLLLGPSTDRPLSAWEASFIPMVFAQYVGAATTGAGGVDTTPLVTVTSLTAARDPMPTPLPGSWLGWFLLAGVMLGGALAWAGGRSGAGAGRGAFLVLAGCWTLISGIAGLAMICLWSFTDHVVAYRNENLLQASILGLAMFGLIAGWARRGGNPPKGLRVLAVSAAALSLLGVALQLLPWFSQVNAPALVFFVPANLGMALGAVRAGGPGAATGPTAALPSRP